MVTLKTGSTQVLPFFRQVIVIHHSCNFKFASYRKTSITPYTHTKDKDMVLLTIYCQSYRVIIPNEMC